MTYLDAIVKQAAKCPDFAAYQKIIGEINLTTEGRIEVCSIFTGIVATRLPLEANQIITFWNARLLLRLQGTSV
jgi:hypothetical protein